MIINNIKRFENNKIVSRKLRLPIIDVFMALSILILFSSIFLFFDDNNTAFKYLSRILFVVCFVMYFINHRLKIDRFYLLWAVFLSLMVFANLIVSYSFSHSLNLGLIFLQAIWVSFLLFHWIDDSKKILFLLILIALFSALYCFRIAEDLQIIKWGTRKIGTMVGTNVNTIGMRLSLGFICSIFFLFRQKNIFIKVICLIASVVLLVFIMITGSRRALIIAFTSFLCFALFTSKKPLRVIASLCLVLAFTVLLYFALTKIRLFYSIIGSRIESFITGFFSSETSAFGADRDNMIITGINLSLRRPILGWGMGTFRFVSGIDHEYSHNNVVELCFALGIPTMVLYYSFFGKAFLRLKIINNRKWRILCLVLLLTTIISDLTAANYSTLIAHLILCLPYAIEKNSITA